MHEDGRAKLWRDIKKTILSIPHAYIGSEQGTTKNAKGAKMGERILFNQSHSLILRIS